MTHLAALEVSLDFNQVVTTSSFKMSLLQSQLFFKLSFLKPLLRLLFILHINFTLIESSVIKNSGSSEISGTPRDLGILSMLGISYGTRCRHPPDFPPTIPLKREIFKDPLQKSAAKWLWKAIPRSPSQVVTLTNWAYINDYSIQTMDLLSGGATVSTLTSRMTRDSNCTHVLLVDGTRSLVKMKMVGKNLIAVETGVKISKLLEFLEEKGYGLPISPIPGQEHMTVSEAIAIGAYGIGVNSFKEKSTPFGSVSSLVMSFKTITWDRVQEVYALKKMDRPDPRSLAFLTNLGRSFLTEVTLLVQPSYQLRCQTFSEFGSENLFASPNSTFSLVEESFAYLVEDYGKVEVSYFPYADRSWVKVWSREVKRPLGSLKVNKKYLSGASSPVTNVVSALASNLISRFPSFAPSVTRMLFDIGVFRMRLSGANDIWGTSHDTFFTFTNDTEPYNSRGYVVLTSRSEIQQVVHDFYEQFSLLRDQFKQLGKYPASRPLKIRISRVDSPTSMKESASLVAPALSVLAPAKGHPEFTVAIIFEMEFLPSDPSGQEFIDELEPWIYANYQGDYANIRPLWSTEWAHDQGSTQYHEGTFKELIKYSYGTGWNQAIRVLNFYDPHGVFRNPFFDSWAKT